jgi:hypothetical protein
VTFANSFRISKVNNVAFVNFDIRPYGGTFTGCNYSALAWSVCTSWRLVGQGGTNTTTGLSSGIVTEGFDMVEVVCPDVQVGDIDPTGIGAGYPGPAGLANGNGWIRYCRMIGIYIAPEYLPPDTFDAAGNQLTGYGHNDSLQLYGSSAYYGFTFIDGAHWGSPNCALQAGGWGGTSADNAVGPIPFFMRLSHTLLINPSVGSAVRYPIPANAQPAPGGSAINGYGRNGQHYADQLYTTGSLYTTNWAQVSNSRCTVAPRPSVVGAWTQDNVVATWPASTWNRICPVPDDTRRAQIWSATPPVQTAPVVPAIGATS